MRPSREILEPLRFHAGERGIVLSDHQLTLFGIYMSELMLWNEKTNLTGLRTPDRILSELFLDSLIPAARIPLEGILLDVGSGAGFPGVPLKILCPGLEVHLLESRAKRVSFLKQVVRLLGLSGIEVIRGRIETVASLLPLYCYPLVAARALAPFPKAVAMCSPRLCSGGTLICYLGEHAGDLMAGSLRVLENEELEIGETVPYSLPGKKGQRHIVMLRKK